MFKGTISEEIKTKIVEYSRKNTQKRRYNNKRKHTGKTFYYIESGKVSIIKEKTTIAELKYGQFLGLLAKESADSLRNATVCCSEDTTIYEIDYQFSDYLEENHAFEFQSLKINPYLTSHQSSHKPTAY